jgi:hypothetical protein
MILSVTRPAAPLALVVVWYTQVSPTVTGNGIELGATYEFEVEVAPDPPPEPAPPPEPRAAPVAVATEPAELVPPVPAHWLTCGLPAFPVALHPARTIAAALARTVAAGRCLLTATA